MPAVPFPTKILTWLLFLLLMSSPTGVRAGENTPANMEPPLKANFQHELATRH